MKELINLISDEKSKSISDGMRDGGGYDRNTP